MWPGPWVSCPHAQQEPCLPDSPSLPVHRHDQSPITVLMMNHSNLLDLKQKRGCYGFMGCPLYSLGFGRWGGVFFPFVHLALVAVLLASESLPCPRRPLFYSLSSFPLTPSPCSTWKLHGPLCVCVHVCACIYMYREIYMWGPQGKREGWNAAQGLQPGHYPVEPVICPFLVAEIKGRWVGFIQAGLPVMGSSLSSLQVGVPG